jgi:hypothetical protein
MAIGCRDMRSRSHICLRQQGISYHMRLIFALKERKNQTRKRECAALPKARECDRISPARMIDEHGSNSQS